MDMSGSFIPITKSDRARWDKQADAYMARVDWADKTKAPMTDKMSPTPLIPTTSRFTPQSTAISLVDIAHEESNDQLLLTEAILHVIQTIRKGLKIGLHLEELYTKASGLDLLIEQNKTGKLPTTLQGEFAAKVQTRAALTIFALSSYVVWDLAAYRTEDVSNVVMTVDEPGGINFASTQEAIRSTFFYFGKGVQEEGKVDIDAEFIKFALLYFRHVIAAVKMREGGLKCKEPFTDRKYKLDDCEFIVDGFEVFSDRSVVSVEFNKVLDKDIVGNREAKHAAQRIVHWMLCFNPLTKINPIVKFGAFPFIRLGYGEPGTGKSMLIGRIATMLDELCKWLEIPFLFHPFPTNIISTYQGGSAERMTDWMRPFRDPSKIIYGPIDDAENIFRHRGRENASEGDRGVSQVFLPSTEGATAPRIGNTLIDLMTNRPGDIDSAVLSRVTTRFPIDGAKTINDHFDQDYLDFKRYAEVDPRFVNLEPPEGYTYLDDQRSFARLTELAEKYFEPKEERIRAIFNRVKQQYHHRQHRFFATLEHAVQGVFPGYTSRDKRNIYTATATRVMDFNFPADWFVDPKTFFRQSDDEKLRLLTEQMKANMGTLTYADIRLEETLRYLDNMVKIADKDREAKIEALIRDHEIRDEATRRYQARLPK